MFVNLVKELEYLEDDIIAGLGKDDGEDEMVSELTSDLDLALQGFGEEPAETDELKLVNLLVIIMISCYCCQC